MDWVGWHLPELVGTCAPLVGAWLMTAWCALVSAAVAAWWAGHEVRTARSTAADGGHSATDGAVSVGVDTGEQASDVRGQSA